MYIREYNRLFLSVHLRFENFKDLEIKVLS